MANELDRMTRSFRESELQHILESATNLKNNATDINETLSDVENYLQILKNMAQEVRKSKYEANDRFNQI